MEINYSQDDLTNYLERKFDTDGNDLEYELAMLYQWQVWKIYNV